MNNKFTLPYAKAYTAGVLGYLAVNLKPEHIQAFNQAVGWSIPEQVVYTFTALIVAGCVWLVPNKKTEIEPIELPPAQG